MENVAIAKAGLKDVQNYAFGALPYILVPEDLTAIKKVILDTGDDKYWVEIETVQVLRTNVGDTSIVVPVERKFRTLK